MNITVGDLDDKTRTVSVTFEDAGVTHTRPVNACYGADGKYDAAATKARVSEVALGVANKIALGVINNPVATDAKTSTDTTTA